MPIYYILPTIAEESLESWIWTNDNKISSNGFILIKNPINNKTIRTFKRTLDNNFVSYYRKHNTNPIDLNDGRCYLILNEYFRNLLNVKKNETVELEISESSFIHNLLLTHWYHPNPVIQFANRATIFSILMGILALTLTIYSIYLTINPC